MEEADVLSFKVGLSCWVPVPGLEWEEPTKERHSPSHTACCALTLSKKAVRTVFIFVSLCMCTSVRISLSRYIMYVCVYVFCVCPHGFIHVCLYVSI